jgi:hypothetical protein
MSDRTEGAPSSANLDDPAQLRPHPTRKARAVELHKSQKDILSGLVFIGFGAAFAAGALGYPMGTATRMGAGYFPFALSLILAAFGIAILVKGVLHRGPAEALGVVPWRGAALILGAIIFFGFSITRLGFVPTLFVTVFASALASRTMTILGALALALGMVVLCYVIFIRGLGVTVPLVGPWLTF